MPEPESAFERETKEVKDFVKLLYELRSWLF